MILQIIISNGILDLATGILAKISVGTGIWYPPSRPSLDKPFSAVGSTLLQTPFFLFYLLLKRYNQISRSGPWSATHDLGGITFRKKGSGLCFRKMLSKSSLYTFASSRFLILRIYTEQVPFQLYHSSLLADHDTITNRLLAYSNKQERKYQLCLADVRGGEMNA